ncbi:hypothetical protein HZH68_012088 [Vespula germanica]|uniref:Galactosyltransferase N-terminal domain-containing protein n=1 Tax=Vespula germanica TaxID=30212 RepID=A0A834JKL9_VESGE|nr:hypothetical protein HZH68_012088 [Vespula germanica]
MVHSQPRGSNGRARTWLAQVRCRWIISFQGIARCTARFGRPRVAFRYADRTYRNHPRGLIIYGPATVSSIFRGGNNNNNNNNNNNVSSKMFLSSGKGDNGGSGLANITKPEAGVFPTSNVVGLPPGSPQYASNATNNATIQQCPLVSPNLVGPVAVSKIPPEISVMEKTFTEVNPGGRGCPTNCVARDRVAIIIPFRDRPQHLQALLFNVHPILLRQQIDYQIFVVEQEGLRRFEIKEPSSSRPPNIVCFYIIAKGVNEYSLQENKDESTSE